VRGRNVGGGSTDGGGDEGCDGDGDGDGCGAAYES
jgi:hypothetical protein